MKTWFTIPLNTKQAQANPFIQINKKHIRGQVALQFSLSLLCILSTFMAFERWQANAQVINEHAFLLEKRSNNLAIPVFEQPLLAVSPNRNSTITKTFTQENENVQIMQQKLLEIRMHNVYRGMTRRSHSVTPDNAIIISTNNTISETNAN